MDNILDSIEYVEATPEFLGIVADYTEYLMDFWMLSLMNMRMIQYWSHILRKKISAILSQSILIW